MKEPTTIMLVITASLITSLFYVTETTKFVTTGVAIIALWIGFMFGRSN